MSGASPENEPEKAKTFREIQEWIFEVPLECRPYDECLHNERRTTKWVREERLVEAHQQISEEKKWAKHWAEEASIRKRELEDSEECTRTIRELAERLQRIRECKSDLEYLKAHWDIDREAGYPVNEELYAIVVKLLAVVQGNGDTP